jgi:hypothetical protein
MRIFQIISMHEKAIEISYSALKGAIDYPMSCGYAKSDPARHI